MVTVIYIDVLIFVNIIVDYFLLMITAFFTGAPRKRVRTALAAFAGSLLSLVILIPEMHIVLSLLVKAAGAFIMAAIAYGVKNPRYLLRNSAYLFVASGLVAGGVIFAGEVLNNNAFVNKNLGIYIDVSPLTLIIVVLVIYIMLALFELLFKKHRRLDKTYRATLSLGGRRLEFDALIDSGNKLYDALSGRDAVVLKRSFSKKLLDQKQLDALEGFNTAGDSSALADIGEFALLPFSSLGGSGLLLGFGADMCSVDGENGKAIKIERPFVAFADDKLLGETDGIIGYDAVEE